MDWMEEGMTDACEWMDGYMDGGYMEEWMVGRWADGWTDGR